MDLKCSLAHNYAKKPRVCLGLCCCLKGVVVLASRASAKCPLHQQLALYTQEGVLPVPDECIYSENW